MLFRALRRSSRVKCLHGRLAVATFRNFRETAEDFVNGAVLPRIVVELFRDKIRLHGFVWKIWQLESVKKIKERLDYDSLCSNIIKIYERNCYEK